MTITLAPTLSIAPSLRAWCDALALRAQSQEIAPNTAKLYETGARRYLAWCAGVGFPWYLPDTLREWKADELSSNKPASVNAWLAGVRSWVRWLVETGQIPVDPLATVEGVSNKGRKSHHAREPLTVEEMRRLLALPDTSTPLGKRDLAILSLMAYTGIRTIECHRANLDNLGTRSGRRILNIQGKGRTEADEFVIIEPAPEAALQSWLAERGNEPGPLFTSLSNRNKDERLGLRSFRGMVTSYYNLAGIVGNKTTHSLRHTVATVAILNGAPVQKVKSLLRHASLDTTMIYYTELDRLENPAEGYVHY